MGRGLGLITPRDLAVFLDASVLTMLVAPLLLRAGPHLAAGARKLAGLERVFGPAAILGADPGTPPADHVVVPGYGLGGRLLAASLRKAGVQSVVVELDPDRVRAARSAGEHAIFGDATSSEILAAAHVPRAMHVAVLINEPDAAERAVRAVRRIAADVPVTARGRFLHDLPPLRAAGATHAVAQEVEALLELIEHVLVVSRVPAEESARIVSVSRNALSLG